MKVSFYGVRGSIPTPGPTTVRYGGNTTCLSIETNAGDRIIIDGGSGIRELGLSLLGQGAINATIFITHTHWDHIQGLPFFVPFFIPGNELAIYGAFDPVYQKDLKTILSGQMEYCYFPVRSNELKATVNYSNLTEGQQVRCGSALVTPVIMNHPVLTYGYKVEADDAVFFFTGDHEPVQNIYSPDEKAFVDYQRMIDMKEQQLMTLVHGADLIVADAQYTKEEYPNRVGWGHGTPDYWIAFAERCQAKMLHLTHHEPTRTDDQIDAIDEDIHQRLTWPESLHVELAKEGVSIQL
ncbi:MAG: MBL fold metallo-hydrolase [Bdellovibrionales bacterium]|nr:MBL fold metallo-hydrolase [Bdellovibrionales bacterium]